MKSKYVLILLLVYNVIYAAPGDISDYSIENVKEQLGFHPKRIVPIEIQRPKISLHNQSLNSKRNRLVINTAAYTPLIMSLTANQGEGPVNLKKKSMLVGGLFIPTIISGYKIASWGKPYDTFMFTTHKLTAMANLIILNQTYLKMKKNGSINTRDTVSMIFMNSCFATTIITGALLSIPNLDVPDFVNGIHTVAPALTIFSSGLMMYLLNK